GGHGRAALPGPGGARHRASEQAPGVRAAGAGLRHCRRQRAPRLPGRLARLQRRIPDPGRPRTDVDPRPHEQPAQARGPRRLRPHGHRAAADRGRAQHVQRRVPAHEARADGAHPPPPGPASRGGRAGGAAPVSEEGAGTLTVPAGCHAVTAPPMAGMDVAVVASRYNAGVVQKLLDGAIDRLVERGISRDRITIVFVPGAWELPLACRRLAEAGGHQAVIALGCVVRGGTPHFEYVCSEASRGVIQASLDTGLPVSFGLLTTDTMEQAEERAGGAHGNKGAEAADAAVDMAQLMRALPRGRRM